MVGEHLVLTADQFDQLVNLRFDERLLTRMRAKHLIELPGEQLPPVNCSR